METDPEEKTFFSKVIIFVFFAHKKHPRSFIMLRLNHLCHMDCFNSILIMFLALECGSCVAGFAALRFNQKYLLFFLKMNKGLADLERHEVEELMTEYFE